MQWLIDIVKAWIVEQGYLTTSFVNRGDPASYDFDENDLMPGGSWVDLDLSGIVPEGAEAVLLMVLAIPSGVGKMIKFRKNGNAENKAIAKMISQVTSVEFAAELIVPLDDDRKIEVLASIVGFDVIAISVVGWWK